jgi:hypothetical protein
MDERRKDMSMRDKIAEIIREGEEGALLLSYEAMADAIIAALPDYEAQQARIKELEAALGEFARFASRKEKNGASVPFGQSKLHAARAALKGEKT